MEILIAIFGAFTLASVVALIRFEGNPLFAFSFLLSLASMLWLASLYRQDGKGRKPKQRQARRSR